jgi:hypothetical protein
MMGILIMKYYRQTAKKGNNVHLAVQILFVFLKNFLAIKTKSLQNIGFEGF